MNLVKYLQFMDAILKLTKNMEIQMLGIILLIFLIILLILLLLKNKHNDADNNKRKITSSFDTSLLTDTSSLDNKSFTLTTSFNDEYYVSVVMNTTTSNASIGSYTSHDYLYSIYDGNPNNELTLTLKVSDNENNDISNTVSDIVFTIELGDKDSHTPITLDKANENNKTTTYISNNTITIYSITVDWYITI